MFRIEEAIFPGERFIKGVAGVELKTRFRGQDLHFASGSLINNDRHRVRKVPIFPEDERVIEPTVLIDFGVG